MEARMDVNCTKCRLKLGTTDDLKFDDTMCDTIFSELLIEKTSIVHSGCRCESPDGFYHEACFESIFEEKENIIQNFKCLKCKEPIYSKDTTCVICLSGSSKNNPLRHCGCKCTSGGYYHRSCFVQYMNNKQQRMQCHCGTIVSSCDYATLRREYLIHLFYEFGVYFGMILFLLMSREALKFFDIDNLSRLKWNEQRDTWNPTETIVFSLLNLAVDMILFVGTDLISVFIILCLLCLWNLYLTTSNWWLKHGIGVFFFALNVVSLCSFPRFSNFVPYISITFLFTFANYVVKFIQFRNNFLYKDSNDAKNNLIYIDISSFYDTHQKKNQ